MKCDTCMLLCGTPGLFPGLAERELLAPAHACGFSMRMALDVLYQSELKLKGGKYENRGGRSEQLALRIGMLSVGSLL